MTLRALDLPFFFDVSVDDLILAYLKTLLDQRQLLGVDTLELH